MQSITDVPTPFGDTGGLARFRAYLAERFPVPVTFLLSLATAAGAYAAAQAEAVRAGAPIVFDGGLWTGIALIFLFLFHLRVFDEHKDHALDAETRPDRPVQRGIVSLAELRVIGAVALALELALAFTAGAEAGLVYLIPVAYSVLMFFEFFAAEWLAARLGLYALTHTIVMSLLAVAVAVRVDLPGSALTPELWAFAALNLSAYLGVDVLRKTWAPDNEIDGLDSWSKSLGLFRACVLGGAILIVSAVLGGYIGWQLGGGLVWLGVVGAVTAWGITEVMLFASAPSVAGEKKLQAVAGLHILVVFVGLAVVAAVTSGAVFAVGGATHAVGV